MLPLASNEGYMRVICLSTQASSSCQYIAASTAADEQSLLDKAAKQSSAWRFVFASLYAWCPTLLYMANIASLLSAQAISSHSSNGRMWLSTL